MRVRRSITAAGLALALVGTGAVTQLAQGKTKGAEVMDDKGDTTGPLDLTRTELARNSDGRVRAEFTMVDDWDAHDLSVKDGAPGSVCVHIWTKRDPTAEPADYLACITAGADGTSYVGRVMRERSNGLATNVATAEVTRPTTRTAYLRFTQGSIGKPSKVQFAARSTYLSTRCPAPLGCVDSVPGQGVARLTLRSG